MISFSFFWPAMSTCISDLAFSNRVIIASFERNFLLISSKESRHWEIFASQPLIVRQASRICSLCTRTSVVMSSSYEATGALGSVTGVLSSSLSTFIVLTLLRSSHFAVCSSTKSYSAVMSFLRVAC